MGKVIEVKFGKPSKSEPNMKVAFATGLLETLQLLGIDRIDIAEAVADLFVAELEKIDPQMVCTVNYRLPEGSSQHDVEFAADIAKQVTDQVGDHFRSVGQNFAGSLAQMALGAVTATTLRLSGQ